MRKVIYKSFRISGYALLDPETGFWIPHSQVAHRAIRAPVIKGPSGIYSREAAAETFAIQMGEIWVDGRTNK
jgi:hypothetical protein